MTGTFAMAALLLAWSGPQAPAAPETMQGVIQELRALRETVERALGANARLQLLMGRLQLQEARIQALSRQAAEIDARSAGLSAERDGLLQQRIALQQVPQSTADPREREMAREMLETLAGRLKELEGRQAAMVAEQANVQQLIAAEQSRWGEFNARLEDLDRLLSQPRR